MSTKSQPTDSASHIAIFEERAIRRAWHNEEWWFSVVDVIGVLSESSDVKQYIKKMRSRDPILDANWGTTCTPFHYWLQTVSCAQRIAPTPKVCSASFNPSLPPRLSHSNVGWRRLGMSG